MNTLEEQFRQFADIGFAVDFTTAIISLGVSFILSAIVAKIYQYSYRGVSYSPAFMQTLVICAMVISVVMLIIGSNIARAFSLVGALSIIRFRNAVKDPRDVAFIFLAMGIGMACGTRFFNIAFLLTAATGLAVLGMSFFRFGSHGEQERLLRIQAPATKGYENIFDDILRQFTNSFSLMSVESSRMGTEVDLLFNIKVKESFKVAPLIEALSALNEHLRIQVVGTSHALDL